MPTVKLNRNFDTRTDSAQSPLPQLLQTPAGLALIEIQGTIHAPIPDSATVGHSTEIGRLEFPMFQEAGSDAKEGSWMKKVYLYIGKHQRLVGEVKKLPKPFIVLAKSAVEEQHESEAVKAESQSQSELNMQAIIRHKIIFSSRPEPVGL